LFVIVNRIEGIAATLPVQAKEKAMKEYNEAIGTHNVVLRIEYLFVRCYPKHKLNLTYVAQLWDEARSHGARYLTQELENYIMQVVNPHRKG